MKIAVFKKLGQLSVLLAVGLLLTGCGREISSDIYHADAVGETSRTYAGTIIQSRAVTVQDSERLQDNGLGIIGGGAAGALAGSQVGKGKGNTVATIGGGLLGAVGGAYAEKALKTQGGMEYVVALDNGEAKTVVQGPSPQFSVGQSVWVIESQKGRSRIVARQ